MSELNEQSFVWSDGACETIEQLIDRKFEKNWNDSAYALSTHFEAMMGEIEWCQRQIKIQNKVIKELWSKLQAK